jgi:nucleotide-binding universal stress UspA family protein
VDYHIPTDKIQPVYRENILQNPAKHILEYAREIQADLLLTGARGHSVLRNMLFGSVTEALIEQNHEFPLLIVR